MGMHVTCDFLPGISKLLKGIDNIADKELGKKVDEGKRPLLYCMIEKLLSCCETPREKLRILFHFQFLLRAEHYVQPSKNDKNQKCPLKMDMIKI